jgi:cytochrome c oxidase subunit 2
VQFDRTLVAALVIFIAAQVALAAIAWKFRSRGASQDDADGTHSNRGELIWMGATAVLFLGLLAMGARTWASVQFTAAPPDAEPIEVLGRQFAWNFRYPGPDKKFGRTDIRYVNDAAGNPFGLDESDASGKDDVMSATLRVPAGRPVVLTLTSRDVIHSFFVRELRVKQDLVPGMRIPLHFRADVPGTFEVPCSELCGLGHHQMRAAVIVMPAEEFDSWKRRQTQ